MTFTTTQAEHRQECRIVSLDIHGAFDSVCLDGLLQHLWSMGVRDKAFCLLQSYLRERRLFVFCCGHTSSQLPFTAGLPQGGIWSH